MGPNEPGTPRDAILGMIVLCSVYLGFLTQLGLTVVIFTLFQVVLPGVARARVDLCYRFEDVCLRLPLMFVVWLMDVG